MELQKLLKSIESKEDLMEKAIKLPTLSQIGKRLFDIFFSLLGLIVLFLPFLTISLAIKLDSSGKIIFKQERVGKKGKKFEIYKFRTMGESTKVSGSNNRLITVGNDPRITSVGKYLRKSKLDELPQLFNILKGDMSFVGPRPEVEKYVEEYKGEFSKILQVRPGITDYSSIIYSDESSLLAAAKDPEDCYINEILPQKLHLGLYYIHNLSIINDIKLIFITIRKIFKL